MLDLSCSKGWFVLQALRRHGFERALGIDVHAPDLEATEAVRQHLLPDAPALARLQLQPWRLADVVERIEDLGGPFEVVLCINLYHYLALGSRRLPEVTGSHESIFEQLSRVCGGTLIFSNCVTLDQLPKHMADRARELGLAESYTAERIRAAAAKWFDIQDHGRLGKRPLWTMVRRHP
tara:strand:+ start:83 stop:619 length:537 start_codon:yes stop_codon:yes gene_type:complete